MRLSVLLSLMTLMLLAGCSGSTTPVTPAQNGNSMGYLPMSVSETNAGISSGIGIFGVYDISVDLEHMSAEIQPSRKLAIGESYLVGGTGFFTKTPCSDCLKLAGLGVNPDETIDLIFNIRHPFQKGNIANPPTAINRLDLDVFDLAAVIEPAAVTPTVFPLNFEEIYAGVCERADGYTLELFDVLESDIAMPYFLVVDESTQDPIPTTTKYNKFEMGSNTNFDVTFKMNTGSGFDFTMYLTMGYGASAKKIDRLNPKYYNPEFNRKSAWKVVVTPPQGSDTPALGNTWDDADFNTFYNVKVEVYDWQMGATLYADPDNFKDAPTNNIYAESNVVKVKCEIYGMINDWVEASLADSGDGSPASPLVFNLPVQNANRLAPGEYYGLINVLDSRAPGDPMIDTRDYLIDSPDGINLNNWAIPSYQTYQLFTATVVSSV